MVERLHIPYSLYFSFAQRAGQRTHSVELGAQDKTEPETLKEEVRTNFVNLLLSGGNGKRS